MEFLLKYFRSCPLCQTSFKPVEWLCDNCENQIMSQVQHHRRWIGKSIEHHYLLEWRPKDSQISKLVHSLKGWGFSKPYEIFGELISNHIKCQGSGFQSPSGSPAHENSKKIHKKNQEILFYPSRGRKDHALMLAQKLGNHTGIVPQPLMKQKTTVKQAFLKRRERQSIQMKTISWKGSQALLVDDVVTSGATVRACYKALNQPSKLIAWSLFYRKNL